MVLILTAAQRGARIMTDIVNPPVQLTDEEEQELQAFEEQQHQKEFQELEKQQYQMPLISALGPSGFTETNDGLHAFVGKVVAKAKETFQQKPILCCLWGFRHDEYEMLSCDLFSDDKLLCMPITITACHQRLII